MPSSYEGNVLFPTSRKTGTVTNAQQSQGEYRKKMVEFNLIPGFFLAHPWVREGGEALEIPIDISVLGNMRQFVKYSRLKQFALRALASTINEDELSDLKDQFDESDMDKNSSISLEEMRQALAKDLPWKLKQSRVLEILQAMMGAIVIHQRIKVPLILAVIKMTLLKTKAAIRRYEF